VKAVAISGSPRAPSKSKTLAERMLAQLEKAGCETQVVDVAALPAEALLARAGSSEIDAAMAAIGDAQIVVAATPTYRALYTGAMKCFFDLMPQAHLRGKVCIGLQTGGSPAHFLTVEHGMRPLFASLDGLPYANVYATDDQFADGEPNDAVLARIRDLAIGAATLARTMHGP
jgi:FMN reductase